MYQYLSIVSVSKKNGEYNAARGLISGETAKLQRDIATSRKMVLNFDNLNKKG